jgi:competence ComEA-like helix-hairpin-helix protein
MFYFTRHEWRCLLLFVAILFVGTLLRFYRVNSASLRRPSANVVKVTKKVYINQATIEQLEAISGIGPRLAKSIIDYRTQYSYFYCVEDLAKVKGVGLKKAKELARGLSFDLPKDNQS